MADGDAGRALDRKGLVGGEPASVEDGAVARLEIAEGGFAVPEENLEVAAGDEGVWELEVVVLASPHVNRRAVEAVLLFRSELGIEDRDAQRPVHRVPPER